jgi:uncharacterized membrane protein YgcG
MSTAFKKYTTTLLLIAAATCGYTQDKTGTLLPPPHKIAIDGDIKEWGDSLRYYNTEKRLNYDIANTKDTLYLAIRFTDRVDQMRVLKAGLTFTIDPKGKKKEAYCITFPLNTGSSPAKSLFRDTGMVETTKEERAELMRERLTSLRGIKVTGFKDIEDEMITTSNTYGIQTAVNYDDNGDLVCEAAIPLQYFHVDDLTKNEWSFNFKINGVERQLPKQDGNNQGSGGGGGRHGGGGGGGGGMGGGGGRHGGSANGSNPSATGSQSNELSKTTDFWTKYYLAH